MGLFNSILEKLGIRKAEAAPAPRPTPPKPAPGAPAARPSPPPSPPRPVEVPMVDVVAKLEALAKANPQKLNWKVSIVDLLKLLDIDSSFGARKELAVELGCPKELMGDSAKMNMWLHKTVLRKIAQNGGNVPKELLDSAAANTLEKLHDALLNLQPRIELPEDIRKRAEKPLLRMLELSK